MPLTKGAAMPRGPVNRAYDDRGDYEEYPESKECSEGLTPSLAYELTAPSHTLTDSFVLKQKDGTREREHYRQSMIQGMTRAIIPRRTMIPTSMVSAHIESSFETANLTDVPKSTCPF